MHDPIDKLAEAVDLLSNPKALKRESGAKRLRKLGASESGEALLQALKKELKDKRTWSTQYHLIIALGVVKYEDALPFLWELTSRSFEATILYMALGDAIFRLSLSEKSISESWSELLQTQNPKLLYGALRAIALLRLVPDDATIQAIIAAAEKPDFVNDVRGYPGDSTGLRYWVIMASVGWKTELVEGFLYRCQQMNVSSLKLTVEDALKKKYVKWDY